MALRNFENFLFGYTTCALWSSTAYDPETDEELGEMDSLGLDVAEETLAEMRSDCWDFWESNRDDLTEYATRTTYRYEGAGHDFWLTRNGHGAGFWDRGLGDLGERLSDSARIYGSVDLYVGDDGMVHA